MFELFFKREGSEYNEGVIFQEFQDNFYLVAGGKGNVVWKRFCFPQKKDGSPTDKAIPMSVNLGNRHEAVEMLKKFLKALAAKID